jgi:hypothetical protein
MAGKPLLSDNAASHVFARTAKERRLKLREDLLRPFFAAHGRSQGVGSGLGRSRGLVQSGSEPIAAGRLHLRCTPAALAFGR